MLDEHVLHQGQQKPPPTMKMHERVRVFIPHHRPRRVNGMTHRPKFNSEMHEFNSIVEKNLRKSSQQKKNIIIINYKPVFTSPPPEKTKPPPPPVDMRSGPLQLPEEEDPFLFIEQLYSQLFTDDGELRQGTEPSLLANRVKQIVVNSRRNSMASIVHQQQKSSTPGPWLHHYKTTKSSSLSSSSHILSNTFSEHEEEDEEEEIETVRQNEQISSQSRRKRTSTDSIADYHRFLHQSRPTSTNTNGSHRISMDDTDREELDPLSDVHIYPKTMHPSAMTSLDEDLHQTDSKLFSSSGYQSMKSSSAHSCTNCIASSSSTSTSLLQRFQQPFREMIGKSLQFFVLSKNILLLPLLMFFFRQRSLLIDR